MPDTPVMVLPFKITCVGKHQQFLSNSPLRRASRASAARSGSGGSTTPFKIRFLCSNFFFGQNSKLIQCGTFDKIQNNPNVLLYSAKFKGIPMCSIYGQVNPMWYILQNSKLSQCACGTEWIRRLPEILFSAAERSKGQDQKPYAAGWPLFWTPHPFLESA